MIQDNIEKIDTVSADLNNTINLIEEKESRTMNTIESLNQDVNHLKIVTKMIKIDSCTEMARNGIVESGYYDLDLGSIGSPTKGFCHLPEGNIILYSIFHCGFHFKAVGIIDKEILQF